MKINFSTSFIFLILLLGISCVKQEPEITFTTGCIFEVETDFEESCENKMGSDTCELKYIGTRLIPYELKEEFTSFCLNEGDEIKFENANGDQINFTMAKTVLQQSGLVIFHKQDTCITYCHDGENAFKHFTSEDFKFYIQLGTTVGDYSNYGDIESELRTTFRFYETKPHNTGFLSIATLNIDLLNNDNQNIPLDTSKYVLYPELTLRDKLFRDVYTRKERHEDYVIPYFRFEEGLVGFEDDENVLWIRMD